MRAAKCTPQGRLDGGDVDVPALEDLDWDEDAGGDRDCLGGARIAVHGFDRCGQRVSHHRVQAQWGDEAEKGRSCCWGCSRHCGLGLGCRSVGRWLHGRCLAGQGIAEEVGAWRNRSISRRRFRAVGFGVCRIWRLLCRCRRRTCGRRGIDLRHQRRRDRCDRLPVTGC